MDASRNELRQLRLVPMPRPESSERAGVTPSAVNGSELGAYSPSLFILVTAEMVRSAWQAIYCGRDA